MIFIGNQTACWAPLPRDPFDYALAQGFDAFEWFPDKKPGAGWDENDLNSAARDEIRAMARASGMRLSVHARWQANPLAPDSSGLLLKDLKLARDLGASLLNVHLFHDQGLAAFVEALRPLVDQTREAELQLAIENTPHHTPEEFNELFVLLRRIYSRAALHVGMCLDIGHANLCSATRNDYLQFFDRLDPRLPIIHLHLHENWGDSDTHMPLFTGPAASDASGIRELLARLHRRRFSGSMILEQWPSPPSLLNKARERLLELWKTLEPALEPGAQPAASPVPSSSDTTSRETREPGRVPERQPSRRQFESAEVPDLTAEIAARDRECRSWREKLELVRSLLTKDRELQIGHLIDVAIYLRFLSTGEIACAEDGRHFRPAHHARIAGEIQEHLAGITTSDNAWIIRKIHPGLPSSSPNFQRPEPLTRIRDIAHRNDIAPELKREIKSTLQNKLHRCAGPEDLATSSALLERITAPGASYSSAFVEQFKIFHGELKEFFNARSLGDRLAALLPSAEPGLADLIRAFRRHPGLEAPPENHRDSAGAAPLEKLESLTALREALLRAAAQKAALERQELLLADIGLEDLAFVLLSQLVNAFESSKAGPPDLIVPLKLALKNIALSRVEPHECEALIAELEAWGTLSAGPDREELLRLKASALRCRRFAEDFGARTVALFAGRVEKLGRALGVAEHAIRVFAESEIRSHNVFQLSRLATALLREIRQRLELSPWDVVVPGKAVGRVRQASSLTDLHREPGRVEGTHARDSHEDQWILLLTGADGDEEIPPDVAGVVLAREIPHLSHLAVRARQTGIVFAACEEADEFERLKSSEGRVVCLNAQPDSVSWSVPTAPALAGRKVPARPPRIALAKIPPANCCLRVEQALPENSGGKAFGARRLTELSQQAGAGFRTPAGFVVPFGVMEMQLQASPAAEQEYSNLVQSLAPAPDRNAPPPEEAASVTQRLQKLVQSLPVPNAVVTEASRLFPRDARLIVRSSANCEDVQGFAGAGLYDSVINVAPPDIGSAIVQVWSSLWTERATRSRAAAKIPHQQAHMAVLVQELLTPEFSFILHTVNPMNQNAGEVYAEIVVGLGETLASAAARGSPYRLVIEKHSGRVTTLDLANFSQALFPGGRRGLRNEVVDYSQVALSRDIHARTRLGRRLAEVARFLEAAFQSPQDIEGAVLDDELFLVQSRPQTGLSA